MLDPSILVGSTPITNAGQFVGADGGAPANTNPSPEAAALQAIAGQLADTQQQAQSLAVTVEVLSQLDSCTDLPSAASRASHALAVAAQASQVLIAWRDSESKPCKLVADSANASLESTPLLNAAAEEVSLRGDVTIYPCEDHANRHAMLTVAKFAESTSAGSIVAVPMIDEKGQRFGAVLVIDAKQETSVTLLRAIAPAMTGKFATLQTLQPRTWERFVRTICDGASRSRGKVIAGGLIAFVLAMLVPLPYQVPTECELQPVERRVVAAPFDGPLQTVMVRPGDVVMKGDTLAKINPREIDYELAGLRAELERAVQEKKGLMVKHDVGASKIASLETERIQLEKALLDYQRDNLEIRSPLSGVIVSGDLRQSEGAPLSKGDTMFEIAPLGEMIVELSIPEEDFVHVQPEMKVQFYLHALPNRMLVGTLERVHPQAELREHDNVFIGEVTVADEHGVLRPGMKGRAWIKGDRQPLGWNLFHKGYYSLRSFVGW